MSFCWFTSYRGYPNFLDEEGRGHELAVDFCRYAEAAISGVSYAEAKGHLSVSLHQAETIKAAFQEFGLLYVVPGSDAILLTPVGRQIHDLYCQHDNETLDKRTILLALCRALARYQFANPLPVGGSANRSTAKSSDVLPYLSCYYLMHQLDGVITLSELRGAIFGLQNMADLPGLEQSIREHRSAHIPFSDLPSLPLMPGTANNLKIYFISHLGLDGEIVRTTSANFYGSPEQAFELTEIGEEIVRTVLDEMWPDWHSEPLIPPHAKDYATIESYFIDGVGQTCPPDLAAQSAERARQQDAQDMLDTLLDPEDLETLRYEPKRDYEEGRRRLTWHARAERSAALIREAKRLFKLSHGGELFCEACQFNFSRIYGERGEGYIEAHHKVPISQLTGPVRNAPEDLAMVCSNCHRMLHRRPWISVEELKALINGDSPVS